MSQALVVDPYIFLPSVSGGEYTIQDKEELKRRLADISGICDKFGLRLICCRISWRLMERRLALANKSLSDPALRVALLAFRRRLQQVEVQNPEKVRSFGVKPLFNAMASPEDEENASIVSRSFVYCMANDLRPFFFVSEVEGRNIVTRRSKDSFIVERLRWRIYFWQTGMMNAFPISCISDLRNILFPWTARYDPGLPAQGTFQFIPVEDWHLKATRVIDVDQGKPVYVDVVGNEWARPNTPGAPYHWDVFIKDSDWLRKAGGDHINVVRSGSTDRSRNEGERHH